MTKAVLSRNILFNWFWIAASISLSNALVASSRIRIGAFFNKTLAIAILCLCPPESRTPLSPTNAENPFLPSLSSKSMINS